MKNRILKEAQSETDMYRLCNERWSYCFVQTEAPNVLSFVKHLHGGASDKSAVAADAGACDGIHTVLQHDEFLG